MVMNRKLSLKVAAVGALAAFMLPLGVSTASAQEVDAPSDAAVSTVLGAPLEASVRIAEAPSHWVQYAPMPMALETTGFSGGNWVNVWVTNPDGTRNSQDGHFTKQGEKAAAFANFVAGPGTYKVQVSEGKWPEEQWSQVIEVVVG